MPSETTLSREQYIEQNIGLVHACAHRFKSRGMEYDDLFQAGCMGLVKAYDCFDTERGVRFSTYAVPVILGEIKKLFRDGGTIKVSRRLKELSMKAAKLSEEIVKKTGVEPSVSELAEKLECSCELLVEALCAARPSFSLTAEMDDETYEFDIPIEGEEETIAERMTLKDAIQKLNEQEQEILKERFYYSKTQAQTAVVLGTTQVQVSRKERRIIEKLRKMMGD